MNTPLLSVIVPAFNEEHRLGPSLDTILSYFAAQAYATEVVVVDDGSTDGTCRLVEERMKCSPVSLRLECSPQNMGKGAAVKRGMLAAAGEILLFSDADLSTPIETIADFMPHLKDGVDVVIGTRKHPQARIAKAQPWLRRNLAKGFVVLANVLLGAHLTDFTCGFKSFSRSAGREIFSRSVVPGWSFDAEVLFLANRLGYHIIEVPVTWAHVEGSQIRLKRDMIRSFTGLMEIRRNHRQGVYNLPPRLKG